MNVEVDGAGANQKSDGKDGAPLIVPPPGAVLTGSAPAGPNAALKETPKSSDGVDLAHPCRGRVRIVDADRAIVEEVAPDGSPRKKIAVCGFASSSRPYIPVHDPSWSVWGLNQLYRHIARADRWFDIHYNWDQEVVPDTDHPGWLAASGMPVYMHARQPHIPTSVRYPIEAMIGLFNADYFTSTIAYMLALAIWEIDRAVEHRLRDVKMPSAHDAVLAGRAMYGEYAIGIFGVDLVVQEEYFWQKACAEYWIGLAVGRGVNVVIPKESALCKQLYRYGYEQAPNQMIRYRSILAHQQAAVKERDELLKRLWMLEGVISCNDRWRQIYELRERGAEAE